LVKDLIKLAISYHLLDNVRVAVLKDIGTIRYEEGWESIRRGEEVTIPLWLASILESRGHVEVREQKVTDVEISKYLLIEKGLKGGEFLRLKDNFYVDVMRLLKEIKEIKRSGDVSDAIFKTVRVEADLKDFIRMRLRKIVQIALLGREPETYYQSLLLEERVLLKKLSDIIKLWVKVILGHG